MDVAVLWGARIAVETKEQIGWAIARTGLFEPVVTEAMWRLTAPTDLAVDVGANIGYYSALLSERAAHTIAVEPHPVVGASLARNAARWREVDVVPVAISDRSGLAVLSNPGRSTDNHGEATLEAEKNASEHFSVTTRTLDELLGDRGVGVLKLDVERHELAALRGARVALEAGRIRDIFFEDHDPLPTPVSDLLSSYGYRIYSLQQRPRGVALGPPDGPVPRWHAPTFLATLQWERAQFLVRPNGWHSARPRRRSRS